MPSFASRRAATASFVGFSGLAVFSASVLLAVLALTTSCTHIKYGLASNPVDAQPAALLRGKALYDANCAACHGTIARGDGPAAEGLPVRPTDLVVAQRGWSDGVFHIRTIAREKNGMPSFRDTLTEDERWHVIRYVRSLDAPPSAMPSSPPSF